MIALLNDVKKDSENANSVEFVKCKINNWKYYFATGKKEHNGEEQHASAEVDGATENKIWTICPNSSKS